jgi:low temperature requirement protein LtrA
MNKVNSKSDSIMAHGDQSADFVELFFDLVFVFAITKITHLTAKHIDIPHLFQSMVVFWLIWWAWTQFTWTLNAANTKHYIVRLCTLIATGVAFVMASEIHQAFDAGVLWFVFPYLAVKALGFGLHLRVTPVEGGHRAAVAGFIIISFSGIVAVIVGAYSDPSFRAWWWLSAILMDLMAGFIGGRAEGWKVEARHFAERHALIVIIALGESLIVAASAVSMNHLSQDLIISCLLAVLITCLLWWSYFAWIQEHMEARLDKLIGEPRARLSRDAYSFIHFPLICGIIGIAIGFEKILGHPDDTLSTQTAIALVGGFVLFVGSTAAAVWVSSRTLLIPRLFLLVSAVAIPLSIGRNPNLALGVIVIGLTFINIFEWTKCRHFAK